MAHQYIAQMEEEVADAVFGNVGTLVSFRVGAPDAEQLELEFTPTFLQTDLVNLDKYNAYIKLMIDGISSKPFSMQTLPPEVPEYGKGEIVRQVSRERYGRDRKIIEDKIRRWSGVDENQPIADSAARGAGPFGGGSSDGPDNRSAGGDFRKKPDNRSAGGDFRKKTNNRPDDRLSSQSGDQGQSSDKPQHGDSPDSGPRQGSQPKNRPQQNSQQSRSREGQSSSRPPRSHELEDITIPTNKQEEITDLGALLSGAPASTQDSNRARPSRTTEREMHSVTCSDCGNETEVPFKPDPTRPVLCKSCLLKKRENDKENSTPAIAPIAKPTAQKPVEKAPAFTGPPPPIPPS